MPAILLIDDHSVFAKIFSAYLLRTQHHNFTLENATSVNSATKRLSTQIFDLVVLDNRVPPYFDYKMSIKSLLDANWVGPILLISGDSIEIDLNIEGSQYIQAILTKDDLNEHTLDQAIKTCLDSKSA